MFKLKVLALSFFVMVASLAVGFNVGYELDRTSPPVKMPVKELVVPVSGEVVAYYDNEYQQYAIEALTARSQVEQWSCLWLLWERESSWNPKSHNRSGAYGIAQFMPETWALVKYKKSNDGYVQIDAGLAYIDRRYKKSPCIALAHSLAKGWY